MDSDTCWDLAVSLATSRHHADGRDAGTAAPTHGDDIFQVSTMSALVAGVLDGDTPYSEVMRHGDFGVGTFNALDGEMAAVDGHYYHLRTDGSVAAVDGTDLTPFAAVTFFRADAEVDVGTPHTRDELLALVDGTVPSTSLFYAVRVDGRFAGVTTRTAARQSKPYPRLVAATATQVEHTFTDVRGTVVGFRAPLHAQGTTVAGYHLHFLDDERTVGGHVLDFDLVSGTVSLDLDTDFHVEMPTSAAFLAPDDDRAEVAAEIVRAESTARRPATGDGR